MFAAVIEMLREAVDADGGLGPLTDTLLRRVGGLIYVPDRGRGAARHGVLYCCKSDAAERKHSKEIQRAPGRSPLPEEPIQ